jgi:hypothetical protein
MLLQLSLSSDKLAVVSKKTKAIPVRGHEGLEGCRMSMIRVFQTGSSQMT